MVRLYSWNTDDSEMRIPLGMNHRDRILPEPPAAWLRNDVPLRRDGGR